MVEEVLMAAIALWFVWVEVEVRLWSGEKCLESLFRLCMNEVAIQVLCLMVMMTRYDKMERNSDFFISILT